MSSQDDWFARRERIARTESLLRTRERELATYLLNVDNESFLPPDAVTMLARVRSERSELAKAEAGFYTPGTADPETRAELAALRAERPGLTIDKRAPTQADRYRAQGRVA